MIRYSTLQQKLLLDAACSYLMDYRDPWKVLSDDDREGLADLLDSGLSPADAAEEWQAICSR
jgi:hypothetical protein